MNLADLTTTEFSSVKWSHYSELYERYVPAAGAILEIGVADGGSMLMWQHRGNRPVFGIDVRRSSVPGAIIFRGDVCSRALWHRVLPAVGVNGLMAVVDDGGHRPYQQYRAFTKLWPLLLHGGVYCIEDLHMGEKVRWRLWTALGLPSVRTILRRIWRQQHGPYADDSKGVVRHCNVFIHPHVLFIQKVSIGIHVSRTTYGAP